MPLPRRASCGENTCSYSMKSFIGLCGVIGIICSILAARNCEFISFVDTDGNPPDRADDPPFDTALAGSIGIFGYIITDMFNSNSATDGCVAYADLFGQQTAYPSLATAQFCALIAPIFSGLATFACFLDLCVHNFYGSFAIASMLFLIAFGIQAGTFTLLADPAFCLEDPELQCETGQGAHLSIAATVIYFICSCLMCCTPRGDPFCYNFGFGSRERDEPRRRHVTESHKTTTTTTQTRQPSAESYMDSDETFEEPPKSPRTPRNSKKSSVTQSRTDSSNLPEPASPRTPRTKKKNVGGSNTSAGKSPRTPGKSPRKKTVKTTTTTLSNDVV
eukprot:CAMPEP_0113467690 /NCGR_PEP_ID=MMETSP0014_2-20120614/14952_1 /TAXON_ID=2857 /ORGANISM="Nitzschia sp." /LENGTH=332 /DNA_ID=CAMNT_0000360021 /DNA_START=125 /DNA_END=1123 /DNA_ORIENTATION=- /assembly_acc=CAM_ASM_000159